MIHEPGARYPIDPLHAQKKDSWYLKQSPEWAAMRAMVKTLLTFPLNLRWSVQGFGMMRTYLPQGTKKFRLNVWHSSFTIPDVSTVHDHPWSFKSWIINGGFRNIRFVEDPSGELCEWMRIKCGEMGGSLGTNPAPIRLRARSVEHYKTGDTYWQDAEEIHQSSYDDGTVTLNDRTGDTEMPRVFWLAGKGWVDAKPREATLNEIDTAARCALEKWEP